MNQPRRLIAIVLAWNLAVAGFVHAAPSSTAGAHAFLDAIYKHYPTVDTAGAFDPVGADAAEVFTPGLVRLIRADQARAKGEVGALDGDPLCDCQDDGGMRADIGAVTVVGPGVARAVVTLTFAGTTPPDVRHLLVRLALTRTGWRIDNIAGQNEPSLRALLKQPAGGADEAR